MGKSTDFRYNTGETRVPWAAVGENYNVADLMELRLKRQSKPATSISVQTAVHL